MAELQSADLVGYVAATSGVELDDAAANRAVAVTRNVRSVLDEAASESLFDTEPSNLHRVLEALAEPAQLPPSRSSKEGSR